MLGDNSAKVWIASAAIAYLMWNRQQPWLPQEGKFVHVTGEAATDEVLEDTDFGVSAIAIRLTRKTEMYQWRENQSSQTRKTLGGGTETVTTYSYEKDWSDRAIDSGRFHDPGHDNPGKLPFKNNPG